jgi:F-type H+-transporting ATPase subunit a
MELSYSGLRDIFMGALGEGGEAHLPLIFTLFFYIFFCNMLELIPAYKAATADPSNTLALGVIVFFYVQYQGIKAKGIVGYLKHFLGPMIALAPLFILIEVIGELAKPFSLGMRLFGNIYGEDFMNHLATTAGVIWLNKDHTAFIPIPYQVPIYLLQIFTGAIQAFIFALLTCSYIAILTEKHDDHGHDDDDGDFSKIDSPKHQTGVVRVH